MSFVRLFVAAAMLLLSSGVGIALAVEPATTAEIALINVRVFDGNSATLSSPTTVLVRGDPLQDLELITDPERNLLMIMKDGRIYKDIVATTD